MGREDKESFTWANAIHIICKSAQFFNTYGFLRLEHALAIYFLLRENHFELEPWFSLDLISYLFLNYALFYTADTDKFWSLFNFNLCYNWLFHLPENVM